MAVLTQCLVEVALRPIIRWEAKTREDISHEILQSYGPGIDMLE